MRNTEDILCDDIGKIIEKEQTNILAQTWVEKFGNPDQGITLVNYSKNKHSRMGIFNSKTNKKSLLSFNFYEPYYFTVGSLIE